MSVLPKEIQEKTLANGKTVRVCLYSNGRIVHRLWDGQIITWHKGYHGACQQFVDEYGLFYGDRLNAFTGHIDHETYTFQGSVLTLWPRSVDIIELENDKNNSLVVPTSPIESFKQLEMSSRMALLARKFSLGK
jgi:hypothetical protein